MSREKRLSSKLQQDQCVKKKRTTVYKVLIERTNKSVATDHEVVVVPVRARCPDDDVPSEQVDTVIENTLPVSLSK